MELNYIFITPIYVFLLHQFSSPSNNLEVNGFIFLDYNFHHNFFLFINVKWFPCAYRTTNSLLHYLNSLQPRPYHTQSHISVDATSLSASNCRPRLFQRKKNSIWAYTWLFYSISLFHKQYCKVFTWHLLCVVKYIWFRDYVKHAVICS